MKSYLRILCAVIIGFVVTAPLFNGGTSLNPLAKPAHAQLSNLEFTNLIDQLNGLSTGQQIIDNINPTVFQELGALTNADLSDLISLDLDSIPSFPGISNSTLTILQDLPNGALDDLLSLDVSNFVDLGNLTDTVLGQIDDFINLGDVLSLDPNTLIGEFESILGGDISSLLNTADLFSNFDIGNLDAIAGNLGLDFGDFVNDLTGAINVNIGDFINLDFAELDLLGITDFNDLLGNLGLPTTVLDTLATDLGTTVANLLNVDLADLDLLGIGGLDDLSSIIGINPEDFLDDLVSGLGINPQDILGDFTNLIDLDLNNILDLDLDILSGLGLDNLDDIASLLGADINTLLGDLSTALNIPIGDLANLDLDVLTDVLDLGNIGEIADIIGLDPTNLLNNLSGALGIDIGDFTDIGLDALADLGLDNALDLVSAIGLDLDGFASVVGLSVDDLLNLDITGLTGALGIDSLGGLAGLAGVGVGTAVANLGASLGLSGSITVGGVTITFTAGTGGGAGCNSVFGLGCCNEPECLCSGWCYPPPSSCPGCYQGSACTWCQTSCDYIPDVHDDATQPFFDIEMMEYERWLVQDFFAGYILPSMMAMAEEITNVAMLQVVAIGGFFDAKMELETHRLLQEFHAQAHKDYHPSEGVCVFATNVRGLAMTQRRMDLTHSVMSTRAINRHLGIENDNGAVDVEQDLGEQFRSPLPPNTEYRSGRLKQFQDTYCNPRDNNEKLRFLCGNGGAGAPDPARVNTDVDYYGNFASQRTLPFDFVRTAAETTPAEREQLFDYIAMTKNLYGHKIPYRPPPSNFEIDPGYLVFQDNFQANPYAKYLSLRAMAAKRSVAENSFHAQTALKSQGDGAASGYMSVLLTELGMDGDAITEVLGGGPSYYAQMEVLTKKIYQNPHFYIDLYDKPANVERKLVALKAIGLMQEWDTLEVNLRTEMLSAVLLELGLLVEQERIQNDNE